MVTIRFYRLQLNRFQLNSLFPCPLKLFTNLPKISNFVWSVRRKAKFFLQLFSVFARWKGSKGCLLTLERVRRVLLIQLEGVSTGSWNVVEGFQGPLQIVEKGFVGVKRPSLIVSCVEHRPCFILELNALRLHRSSTLLSSLPYTRI